MKAVFRAIAALALCVLAKPAGAQDKISSFDELRMDFEQACDEGEATSCTYVALFYSTAMGVQQDNSMALHFYQLACERGGTTSCAALANLVHDGLGGPQDINEGTRLLRDGCEIDEVCGCDQLTDLDLVHQ